MLKKIFAFTAATVMFASPHAALAGETVKYTYDAKGRVVKVEHSGTVNDNVKTDYEYDKVSNRKRVKATVPTP